ncbi:hypothetical protein FGO68_gene1319 [Halteria grandinella]|uniref:Uncharacterized protein n=1 Tax=Halteria grandinella TaxID=5974 RepID=A0A8J8T1L3_HALGN|nr:hypothetical protein FGO68_gene1319 [Halteria grandinella]
MAAIQNNTNNYYCSKNNTAGRRFLVSFAYYLKNGNITDSVSQMYQFLQIFDDILISCSESIINASIPNLFTESGNNFFGEQLIQNILYNIGFQITDILDLVFYDTETKEPFWYKVAYIFGDFVVRFFFRDENPI